MSKGETWAQIGMETRTFRARRQHRMACGPACKQTAVLRVCALLAVVFGAFVRHNVLVNNYILKRKVKKAYRVVGKPTRTLPGRLVNIETCNRRLKVAWVGEAMRAEGPEARQLELRTKDLLDVYACRFSSLKHVRGTP